MTALYIKKKKIIKGRSQVLMALKCNIPEKGYSGLPLSVISLSMVSITRS